MFRSASISLKFTNTGKQSDLHTLLMEYRRVVSLFVDMLWNEKKVPSLMSRVFTERIDSWVSAAIIQCAGKQASAIVRGTRKKHKQRVWMLNELKGEGKNTEKLQALLDKEKPTKPIVGDIPAELDARFIKVNLDPNDTSFDGWVTLKGTRMGKIVFPFKRHKHFNKLVALGERTKGLRLSEKEAVCMFQIEKELKVKGKVLGVDVGITNCVASSDGALTKADSHGHTLVSILKKLAAREKGSNGFRETTTQRKIFINWSINQLNLRGVKEVRCENIKDLRRGKKTVRFLSHWTYTIIFGKLEQFCEERGVLVSKRNPAYTSQICSKCGALGVRQGKKFSCSCGNTDDADLNAAANLAGEPIVPREIA